LSRSEKAFPGSKFLEAEKLSENLAQKMLQKLNCGRVILGMVALSSLYIVFSVWTSLNVRYKEVLSLPLENCPCNR
jgi:hypothetical protein